MLNILHHGEWKTINSFCFMVKPYDNKWDYCTIFQKTREKRLSSPIWMQSIYHLLTTCVPAFKSGGTKYQVSYTNVLWWAKIKSAQFKYCDIYLIYCVPAEMYVEPERNSAVSEMYKGTHTTRRSYLSVYDACRETRHIQTACMYTLACTHICTSLLLSNILVCHILCFCHFKWQCN